MAGIASKIHQGRYDSENELMTLLKNARDRKNKDVLDAVEQRLKKVYPKLYQRYVGPLFDRNHDPRFKCYCNNPKSLEHITDDILHGVVPIDALTCDDCWQDDLCSAWGYFGYTRKVITRPVWKSLCEERAEFKFVE